MTETTQNRGADTSLRTPLLFLIPVLFAAIGFAVLGASIDTTAVAQSATSTNTIDQFASTTIRANAAIVVDLVSGKTLYEKNADVQLPLASLTKVPLVLATSEVLKLEDMVTIPYSVVGAGGSESLIEGETWRTKDIVDFTLISSSNSGAEILAALANDALRTRYPNAPHDSATLWRMNDIAHDLDLTHTYFLNVSGLDLSTTLAGAYGSARDVARLYAYAASSEPSLFSATARDGILLTSNEGGTRNAFNTNIAQGAIAGLIMGKTGTTDLAGGNLAIVFDVGLSHPVVAVVLGSTESGRFEDIQKLIEGVHLTITGDL